MGRYQPTNTGKTKVGYNPFSNKASPLVVDMKLCETVPLMSSKDYKERFLGEYYQLDIRMKKLKNFLDRWDELDFEPNCPKELLEEQLKVMQDYHKILGIRAKIEHVELR